MILNDTIELAIVWTPFLTDNLFCYYLDYEPMYAVASIKYFSKNFSDTITLNELVQYPLIYHRRFENLLSNAFHAINLPFSPYCTNDDRRTSLSLAQSEVGCAIVTESTLPSGMIARKINNDILNTRLALIHKQNKKLSKSARLFINHFLKDNTNIQTT